jgi:hypothetical protein
VTADRGVEGHSLARAQCAESCTRALRHVVARHAEHTVQHTTRDVQHANITTRTMAPCNMAYHVRRCMRCVLHTLTKGGLPLVGLNALRVATEH